MLIRIMVVLNVILLGFIWGYPAVHYAELPEIIPSHFRGDGTPDGFGSKSLIWLEAGMATVLFGICCWMYAQPSRINLPEDFKKSPEAVRRFIALFCTLVMLIFAWIGYTTIETALGRGAQITLAPGMVIGLMFVSIIGLLIYLGKANESPNRKDIQN